MNNYVNRSWSQYNQNLVNRGSITFWIHKECLDSWIVNSDKKGRPSFSDAAIQAGLLVKAVNNLPLRSLQGFLGSILQILKLHLKSPHYSLFCKRAKGAAASLPKL